MTLDEKKRLIAMREAGNSYAEIADTLGISKNTIHSMILFSLFVNRKKGQKVLL